MKCTKENSHSLQLFATIFTSLRGLYDSVGVFPMDDIISLEDVAFELVGGTNNADINDYILRYYEYEITIDDLISAVQD